MITDSMQYILVVNSAASSVVSMYDANNDGKIGTDEMWTIAVANGLNHGVAIHDDYLYASSATTVFRWPYKPGTKTSLGTATVVIKNIPSGGHSTRTLLWDTDGMYLAVGSGSNMDSNSLRARVLKCDMNVNAIPSGGYEYLSACKVYADGCRNEVGLRLDSKGRLWGVENGRDNLQRADLGGDIHNNNPSEEVNMFAKPGFYGYPYCWSEGNLTSPMRGGPGTQWADPTFISDGTHTDAWCKNATNVIKPVYNMQAHTAPLDLLFHETPSFPSGFQEGLFVAQHGSWNRQPPVGYQVIQLELDENFNVVSSKKVIGNVAGTSESWTHRPVSLVKIAPCGPAKECLLVTSDASNVVIAIAATGN